MLNIFKNFSIKMIKKLGLSTNKAKTIKELSDLYLNQNIKDLTDLNDKQLNHTLLSVFGIGPWSLNMFEIFSIGKLDVFSSKDAGLRLAMNNSGMIKPDSNWEMYDKYADKWSPYKSIASLTSLKNSRLNNYHHRQLFKKQGVGSSILPLPTKVSKTL